MGTAPVSQKSGRTQRAHPAWPSRLVRVLVGFPPGQSSDIPAWLPGAEMEKALGRPFVDDSRDPGRAIRQSIAAQIDAA